MMNKKIILTGILVSTCILFVGSIFTAQKVNADTVMTVYKSATCGCCEKWVNHMQDNGFKVKAVDVQNIGAVKQRYGISSNLASCHTAIVNGYIVEGHVPASDVKRLLSERKDVLGLAVPGMPIGSPGMEIGERVDRYDVVSFDKEGNIEIFQQY
jgi:hypothetical protein